VHRYLAHAALRMAALVPLSWMALTPAQAQVAAAVDLESDYLMRGYSLSAGKPVTTLDVSYNGPSGIYGDVAVTAAAGPGDPHYLGVIGNLGYVHRFSPAMALDIGVSRFQFRSGYPGGRPVEYTEAYVGITVQPITARVSLSPDYLRPGAWTLYSEVEAGVRPAAHLRLSAHVGTLVYLRDGTAVPGIYVVSPQPRQHYDWRLSASRQIGWFDLHAALSGGGPGYDYYEAQPHSRTRVTVGASWNF
jgi:uncharacterized protein (TIGR02001 family)